MTSLKTAIHVASLTDGLGVSLYEIVFHGHYTDSRITLSLTPIMFKLAWHNIRMDAELNQKLKAAETLPLGEAYKCMPICSSCTAAWISTIGTDFIVTQDDILLGCGNTGKETQ